MARSEELYAETGVDPISINRDDEFRGGVMSVDDLNGIKPEGVKLNKHRHVAGRRDKITMAHMKARMSALYRHGVAYKDIAEIVSNEFNLQGEDRMTYRIIKHHIDSILAYWKEKSLVSMDDKLALVLARYDQLEMLITEAYFESCKGHRTTGTERQIERAKSPERKKELRKHINEESDNQKRVNRNNRLFDAGDVEDNMELTIERVKELDKIEHRSDGNPKWVQMLIDINDKRAKLWSLMNKKEIPNEDHELAKLSDEQRVQRMQVIIETAIARKTGDTGALAPSAPLGGFEKDEDVPEEIRGLHLSMDDASSFNDEDDDDDDGGDFFADLEDDE